MAIVDLASHPYCYVTIGELAEYWRLPRNRVRQQLSAGQFEAIRVGPVVRIRTETALAFERRAAVPRVEAPVRRAAVLAAAPRVDRDERSSR